MEKIHVGILGATGTVGQKFICLLENHPQFEIAELIASSRSAGKQYQNAAKWKQAMPIPPTISGLKVLSLEDILKSHESCCTSKILFSALDSSIAGEAELALANKGHLVISNSKNHRMDPQVPLVIPEVNADHFSLLDAQEFATFGAIPKQRAGIVTNSNCSTMFLAMVLAPLHREFILEEAIVSTMQAISGAGYPGVASMDILGNVIPYIADEEEKLESEPQKILGTLRTNYIELAPFRISAHCNRVPVYEGHVENLSLKFKHPPKPKEVIHALTTFQGQLASKKRSLHSSPEQLILYNEEVDRPQPALDLFTGRGMSAIVGRVRQCPVLDIRMTILGHNTIRGAAGAAILNAEAMLALGYI